MSKNRVVVAKDGTVNVVSGSNGTVKPLQDPKLKANVEALLKQRQELGIRLSQVLKDGGFVVASDEETETIG